MVSIPPTTTEQACWRDIARAIILSVVEKHGRSNTAFLSTAIRQAYPWPERGSYRYRVWLQEVHRYVGRKNKNKRQFDMFGYTESCQAKHPGSSPAIGQ